MPQKLDWADRHLFVGSRPGYVDDILARARAYERGLAKLAVPPKSTMLDGRTVTKREIKSLLTKLEADPPRMPIRWFRPIEVDVAKYERLRTKYKRALELCEGTAIVVNGQSRTKREIQSFLANTYKDICREKSRFQNWSHFVCHGAPTKHFTSLFCSSESARLFLKCSSKGALTKLAKAVSEELPYVVSVRWDHTSVCLFGRDVWRIEESERRYKPAELKLLLLDAIDRERQKFQSLRRRFSGEAGRKLDPLREPIPESVRMYVWRRDEGKCVVCGSQDRLEFDHIIPVIKGGGNTNRNIQLLCEQCNRSKKDRI